MALPSVVLEDAWRWVCPECGHENFVRHTVLQDPEILQLIHEDLRGAVPLVLPEKVFCRRCELACYPSPPGP